MRFILATLLIGIVETSCGKTPLPETSVGENVAAECPAPSRDDYFFPSHAFDGFSFRTPGNDFAGPTDREMRLRPGQMLWNMHEPSLSCGSQRESYRFIWIHPFSTAKPTMIRASGDLQQGGQVVSVRLDGLTGLTVDYKELERRVHTLTAADWAALDLSIRSSEFWRLRTAPADATPPDDGGLWLLEGRRAAGYHVVARYGGFGQPDLEQAVGLLLTLAHIDLDR